LDVGVVTIRTWRFARLVAAVARNVLDLPEFETLRTLRRRFAHGGLPPFAKRSPEDDARIATFATLAELLRVLREFRDRIARGEAVRLVVAEQVTEPGRMRVELVIRTSEEL
jgi:hypothetical protein